MMGRLQVKASVLLCWALTLMISAAQREYFFKNRNSTWNNARNHCQACFKELVTLTPDNIQVIARNISSDHWIGLRKNFNSTDNLTSTPESYTMSYPTTQYINSNFTSNDTSSFIFNWTRWANGDPLAFQNWYPGWPIPKPSPKPRNKTLCCSCSCTCPARTTTPATIVNTTSFNTTGSVTDTATSFNTTGSVTDTATSFTDLTGYTGETTPQSSFSVVTDQTMTTQRTSSSFTTSAPWTTTEMPIQAQCMRSPMLEPEEPEDDDSNEVNYIEDSCVAMLSFGPWIEKNCLDLLPFICYEDRFIGRVNITNITSEYANLTWLPAPGDISHYQVEVKAETETNGTVFTVTDLTYELNNLTAGTHYSVQVIPVKCARNLNPENGSFYTGEERKRQVKSKNTRVPDSPGSAPLLIFGSPNKVTKLIISYVTDSSVSLSWNKPDGNLDFYDLTCQTTNQNVKTAEVNVTSTTFNDLTPGTLYDFTIITGVNDRSKWSDKVNISAYTKPDKVYNLTVSNNTDKSLAVSWDRPKGGFRDILVVANYSSNNVWLSKNVIVNTQAVTVTDLQPGTEIFISVTVRLNDTMVGETQTTHNFTTPGTITNLSLTSTNNSLNATWSLPDSSFSSFTVKLCLDGNTVQVQNLTVTNASFNALKNAAKYTVEVRAVSGIFESFAVNKSIFTLPNPPSDVQATEILTNDITFTWKEPVNTSGPSYNVTLNSSFWGQMWSYQTTATNYKFSGLKSGTNYSFEVRTVAGGQESQSVGCAKYTMANRREITLSMLCTSTVPLKCDDNTTRGIVFQQLRQHFKQLLDGYIDWDLKTTFK